MYLFRCPDLCVSQCPRSVPFWPPAPDESGDAVWSYDTEADDGPARWGVIRKLSDRSIAYPTCAGASQSPIDLPSISFPPSGLVTLPIANAYPDAASWQIVSRPGGHPGFQVRPGDGRRKRRRATFGSCAGQVCSIRDGVWKLHGRWRAVQASSVPFSRPLRAHGCWGPLSSRGASIAGDASEGSAGTLTSRMCTHIW